MPGGVFYFPCRGNVIYFSPKPHFTFITKMVHAPAVAIRIPVQTPVPRLSLGDPVGAAAPLVVGEGFQREPPRNRFPLAVSFASFFAAQRKGPAGGDGTGPPPCRDKRRIRRHPGGISAEAGTRTGREMFRSCGSDLLSQRSESRQRRAGGPFHKGPPDPSSRPKGPAPLDSPARDGRRGDNGRKVLTEGKLDNSLVDDIGFRGGGPRSGGEVKRTSGTER